MIFYLPQIHKNSLMFIRFKPNKIISIFCSTVSRAAATESGPTVHHVPSSYLITVLTAAFTAKASSRSEGYVPGPCLVPSEGPTAGLQHVLQWNVAIWRQDPLWWTAPIGRTSSLPWASFSKRPAYFPRSPLLQGPHALQGLPVVPRSSLFKRLPLLSRTPLFTRSPPLSRTPPIPGSSALTGQIDIN